MSRGRRRDHNEGTWVGSEAVTEFTTACPGGCPGIFWPPKLPANGLASDALNLHSATLSTTTEQQVAQTVLKGGPSLVTDPAGPSKAGRTGPAGRRNPRPSDTGRTLRRRFGQKAGLVPTARSFSLRVSARRLLILSTCPRQIHEAGRQRRGRVTGYWRRPTGKAAHRDV